MAKFWSAVIILDNVDGVHNSPWKHRRVETPGLAVPGE
jgi:hypothetical protein